MIEGTGPGRGVPWWRYRRALTLRWAPSDSGLPNVGVNRTEPVGAQREGRLIARIG